jgi:hypothetical protein
MPIPQDRCDRTLSPISGGSCPACGRSLPAFPGVSDAHELELLDYIRNSRTVTATKRLREISGADLEACMWMVEHMYARAGLRGFVPGATRGGDA